MVNTSLRSPASWFSLQGNHIPLLATAVQLIAHKSFEFTWQRCPLCSAGGVTQRSRVNSLTHKHGGRSNQSIINLLITDSWAVSNIKEAPCCSSSPCLKILGLGARQVCSKKIICESFCECACRSTYMHISVCVYASILVSVYLLEHTRMFIQVPLCMGIFICRSQSWCAIPPSTFQIPIIRTITLG